MSDIVSPQVRSRMMAGIRSRHTRPELIVRRGLHARGIRYSLRKRGDLPCAPDLLLPKFGAAILVHGCYWHRHQGCRYCTTPRSNADFWEAKFRRNVERDAECSGALLDAGWRLATVWECALRNPPYDDVIEALIQWLRGPSRELVIEHSAPRCTFVPENADRKIAGEI